MKNFKMIFYEAITGECPIEEFQDSLDTVSYTHLTLPTN